MAVKGNSDLYPQLAYMECTETGANTLTFAKLEVATGALLGKSKYGMVIHQIQYYLNSAMRKLILDEDDAIVGAVCMSSNITGIDLDAVDVVDNITFGLNKYGAAAAGWPVIMPIHHNFTNLGGLLVPADRLYLAVKGTSLASASKLQVRLWYTIKELSVDEYWDLVEARRIITT
jgi:hypothetical protein